MFVCPMNRDGLARHRVTPVLAWDKLRSVEEKGVVTTRSVFRVHRPGRESIGDEERLQGQDRGD